MCVCVCVCHFALVTFSHAVTFLSTTQLWPHEDPAGEEVCEANGIERYCILGDQCLVGGGVANQPDADKSIITCILCGQTFHEECHRKVSEALSRNSNIQVSADEALARRLWDVASRCCKLEKREMHSCCSFFLEEISKYDAGAYICLWCIVLLESTDTVE